MTITDIIGKGKVFEPPFSKDIFGSIYDKNRRKFMEPMYPSQFTMYFKDMAGEAAIDITNHIVELLNERWKNEN